MFRARAPRCLGVSKFSSFNAPCSPRYVRRRRVVHTHAGIVETGTTLAEAAAGFVALQLLSRVLKGAAKDAATNTAATALKGVNATPDLMFGGQKATVKLALSVLIDAVGMSTYVLPGVGEAADAGWAPVSAVLVQALYGSWILSALDFLEEALPFSDALPSACIGWLLEYSPAGKFVGWVPKQRK
jgi:hypothetical protein